ncbi:MAG: ATP-dependent DNA ligase, partial [Actinomycetota bacterium]
GDGGSDSDGDANAEGHDERGGEDLESSPQAFQETMSALGTESDDSAARLRPFFFDLMYLDGVSLIDQPLQDRLAALHRLAPDHTVPQLFTDDPSVAAAHLDQALGRGHEGVMVKDAASPYQAGRRGKAWRKVKPVHTLDLVVLAAEWGHGRRQGWLSNLHLGARDDDGQFVMVGKTFKGLTDKLLGWQTEQFLDREERRTGHTVYVRPDLVVEIALDGAQVSTRYPGGVALRFARVRGYRPDRDPASADPLDAVRALLPRH